MALVVLAIFLGILSYSMLNIGMGLQKKGACQLPDIDKQTTRQNIKNFITCRPWLIGFLLVQLQWAILAFALDLATVSVITPLMSVGMVALVIFSYFYLKEPISKVELIGIIVIIIGIAILGATSPLEEAGNNLELALEQMSSIPSIIFLTVAFLLTIFFIILSIIRKFKNADIFFSVAAGITDALGAIFLRAYMEGADFRNGELTKEAATHWGWWVIFVLMILLNLTATIYLQVAYQRGKAVIVAPIFAVLAMIVPVFGGILIFDEWSFYFTEGKLGLMAGKIVSLVIVSVGAIMLSLYSARQGRFDDVRTLKAKKESQLTLEEKTENTSDKING